MHRNQISISLLPDRERIGAQRLGLSLKSSHHFWAQQSPLVCMHCLALHLCDDASLVDASDDQPALLVATKNRSASFSLARRNLMHKRSLCLPDCHKSIAVAKTVLVDPLGHAEVTLLVFLVPSRVAPDLELRC
jgi:hypothetical protein